MDIPERDLPLFPLNTVLFPRMPLPLQIFEPRYREMIARCLEERIGFGVLLIREGEEVGEPAVPYDIGTAARIIDVRRLPDGQMHIVTMGVVRFRLLETRLTHPYLSGDIERWEDQIADPAELDRSARRARKAYIGYVADFMELSDSSSDSRQIVSPLDPQILSYTIAANLKVSNEEKQELLEAETIEARLGMEVELLEREREFLQRLKTLRDYLPKDDQSIFSKN